MVDMCLFFSICGVYSCVTFGVRFKDVELRMHFRGW